MKLPRAALCWVRRAGIATCTVLASHPGAATLAHGGDREWRFVVSLDDKPIGYHHFALRELDGVRELKSSARFNVKVLFISAYRYAHDAREHWRGECLDTIDARTDDDGELKTVIGSRREASFAVAVDDTGEQLNGCVMTFAYWNPNILRASHLLNPQTGEYVPVSIEPLGPDIVQVRGSATAAHRYRLHGDARRGGPMRIDLWYSTDQEWLALESTTAGRRLRYRIQ